MKGDGEVMSFGAFGQQKNALGYRKIFCTMQINVDFSCFFAFLIVSLQQITIIK